MSMEENICFLLNEYDWKFVFSLKISILLQSNKLGRNYFKEKQLKKQNFHCFYVILLIADAWKAGFFDLINEYEKIFFKNGKRV